MPRAHFNLGLMYFSGDGVKRNDVLALKHFNAAIKLGHKNSYFYAASIYLDPDSKKYSQKLGSQYKKKAIALGVKGAKKV